LTRKYGESLRIGDDVTVTVVSIDKNKVRIGVKAPTEVRIDREEVRWRMENELANQIP
jgi:carbon storage regulator